MNKCSNEGRCNEYGVPNKRVGRDILFKESVKFCILRKRHDHDAISQEIMTTFNHLSNQDTQFFFDWSEVVQWLVFCMARVLGSMPSQWRRPTLPRSLVSSFGHVSRHDNLSKTILQDTLEGGWRRGRQRKCWMDNIKNWTSLPMSELLKNGLLQKRLEEDLCWISRRPNRSGDWTEPNWTGVKNRTDYPVSRMRAKSIHVWANALLAVNVKDPSAVQNRIRPGKKICLG